MIEEVIILKDLVTESAAKMREGVSSLSETVTEMKEKMAGGEKGAAGLGEGLGAVAGPAMLAAGAVLAVGAALGALTLAAVSASLEAAELKEKLLATFSALGGGEEAGARTLDTLNKLSDQLGVTRESLVPAAKAFQAMGITDLGQLKGQITALTSATALFGETGGQSYQRIVSAVKDAAEAHTKLKLSTRQLREIGGLTGTVVTDAAKRMGLTTAQFAAQLKAGTVDAGKFGDALEGAFIDKGKGPLEAMANSLPNLMAKLKENVSRLFEDVNVKPVTDALRGFFDIFSLSEPSGRALQAGIVPIMNRIFAITGKVILGLKHLTLDVIIFGLKAYIALKPIIKWVRGLSDEFGLLEGALLIGKSLLVGIGAAVVVSAAAFGLLAAAIAATGAFIIGAVLSVIDFAKMIGNLAGEGATIAANFIAGLVDGIKAGYAAAVGAVTGLGTKIKDGIKDVLGIHSPSRVMMEMGAHVSGGFAAGIGAGMGRVGAAADMMGGVANDNAISATAYAPVAGASSVMSSSSTSADRSVQVTVEPGAIVIHGGGKDAQELTEESVALIFERVALAQGA